VSSRSPALAQRAKAAERVSLERSSGDTFSQRRRAISEAFIFSILMQALASKQDRDASGDGEVKDAIYLPTCMQYNLNGAPDNGERIAGNFTKWSDADAAQGYALA
jgi:hypothetical protein